MIPCSPLCVRRERQEPIPPCAFLKALDDPRQGRIEDGNDPRHGRPGGAIAVFARKRVAPGEPTAGLPARPPGGPPGRRGASRPGPCARTGAGPAHSAWFDDGARHAAHSHALAPCTIGRVKRRTQPVGQRVGERVEEIRLGLAQEQEGSGSPQRYGLPRARRRGARSQDAGIPHLGTRGRRRRERRVQPDGSRRGACVLRRRTTTLWSAADRRWRGPGCRRGGGGRRPCGRDWWPAGDHRRRLLSSGGY